MALFPESLHVKYVSFCLTKAIWCLFVSRSEDVFVTGALDQWTELHLMLYVHPCKRNAKTKFYGTFTVVQNGHHVAHFKSV